jgi:hypothetical protein
MVDSRTVLITSIGAYGIATILTVGAFSQKLSVKNTSIALASIVGNTIIGMFCVS